MQAYAGMLWLLVPRGGKCFVWPRPQNLPARPTQGEYNHAEHQARRSHRTGARGIERNRVRGRRGVPRRRRRVRDPPRDLPRLRPADRPRRGRGVPAGARALPDPVEPLRAHGLRGHGPPGVRGAADRGHGPRGAPGARGRAAGPAAGSGLADAALLARRRPRFASRADGCRRCCRRCGSTRRRPEDFPGRIHRIGICRASRVCRIGRTYQYVPCTIAARLAWCRIRPSGSAGTSTSPKYACR